MYDYTQAKMNDDAAHASRDNQAFLFVYAGHAAIVEDVFSGEHHVANCVLDFVHDLSPTHQPAPADARRVDQTSGARR